MNYREQKELWAYRLAASRLSGTDLLAALDRQESQLRLAYSANPGPETARKIVHLLKVGREIQAL